MDKQRAPLVLLRDALARRSTGVSTQTAEEPGGLFLLRGGEPAHETAQALDMGREHLLDQLAPLWRQLAEHLSVVLGASLSTHQATSFESLDDVRRARPGDQDPVPDLP